MRFITTLLSIAICQAMAAQFYLGQLETIPCAGDSIDVLENWEAYQTTDNIWWGPRDTNICINFAAQSYSGQIDMGEIDIQRPVFMRYRGPDVTLYDDMIYFLGLASGNFDSVIDFENQEYCNQDYCTGSLIGIEIPAHPDSTDLTAMRWYNSELDTLPDIFGDIYCSYTHCVPTEFFNEGNVLKEIVFKFMFDTTFTGVFEISSFIFEPVYDVLTIPDYLIYEDQFNIITDSWGDPLNFLVDYPGEQYPSEYQHIDLSPSPNVDTVSTVVLTFGEMDYVLFQPFVDLRGGLVEGDDSLRHSLSIVNEGAIFCLNSQFIDVIFNDDDRYVHRSGTIDFKTQNSCMQFRPNSELRIASGAYLKYGDDGHGTIALFPDAELVLERDAKLLLNNRLVLMTTEGQEIGADVVIDIPPFTKVILGKHFKVKNFSFAQESKLVFNMLGGFVDISKADQDDMEHIEFRYPTLMSETTIEILGNPVENSLVYRYQGAPGKSLHCLMDIQGKTISKKKYKDQLGINHREMDLSSVAPGTYFLSVEFRGILESQQVVVQ